MKTFLAVSVSLLALTSGAALADGKEVYDKVCAKCHRSGAEDAPVTGDKEAWASRIATGKDALYRSAIEGKNAMPPKGNKPALTDDEVRSAVDYLVGRASE